MSNLYKFKLTTLSPVYIGCEEKISPYSDYIYKEGKVYFIDENKLIQFFKDREDMDEVMDDYIDTIQVQASSNLQDRHNLEDFFQKYGLKMDNFISYSLDTNGKITQTINRTINSSGRSYIPGSSLKGAIRTCLLYHHIKEENINPVGRSPYIGQEVFGSFVNDVFKYLSVSDTNTIANTECEVLKAGRYNLKKKSLDVPVVVEAIKPYTSFNISINLKGKFESKFGYLNRNNIQDLLVIINEFYIENIVREIKALEENIVSQTKPIITFYQELNKEIIELKENKLGALLRLGGGKTFYENSILLALDKDKRDKIITDGNSRKKLKRDKNFFPKTRAMTIDNGQYKQVLGWVKIELQ